jgi:hypothetical protein
MNAQWSLIDEGCNSSYSLTGTGGCLDSWLGLGVGGYSCSFKFEGGFETLVRAWPATRVPEYD